MAVEKPAKPLDDQEAANAYEEMYAYWMWRLRTIQAPEPTERRPEEWG